MENKREETPRGSCRKPLLAVANGLSLAKEVLTRVEGQMKPWWGVC